MSFYNVDLINAQRKYFRLLDIGMKWVYTVQDYN